MSLLRIDGRFILMYDICIGLEGFYIMACLSNAMRKQRGIEFVVKAKKIHADDDYDYSKVDFVSSHKKVIIVCPEHGEFLQSPSKHLLGQGCPKCVVRKRETTCMKHYGVRNPLQSPEIVDKVKQTVRERYGVDYAPQAKEVRDKIVATFMENYGVDNPRKAPLVDTKIRETCLLRYGCENPLANADIQEKRYATMRKRYGVKCALQNDDIKEAMRQRLLFKYGVENVRNVPEFEQRRIDTCMACYGSSNPFGNKEIQSKILLTNNRLYGVDYPAQNKDIMEKQIGTRLATGVFGHSAAEDLLYDLLCSVFGENDVLRQYKSDIYPFRCDFYIVSRDMYIELNAYWTHGGHWYTDSDKHTVDDWNIKYGGDYDNTFSVRDVAKRNVATTNHLNYVVFWESDLSDARIWFELGCPNGFDWDHEYSWIQ